MESKELTREQKDFIEMLESTREVIALEVVPAADYFKNLHDRITRNIEQAVDLFKH